MRVLVVRPMLLVIAAAFVAGCAWAQAPTISQPQPDQSDDPSTVFPHSHTSRFYIGGQFNTIYQGHPAFRARYSGPQSLRPQGEAKDSRTFTLYTGVQLTSTTEVLFHGESAGGRGIGDALGLAGFTNLDVVRNPALGAKPYLARLMVHQVVPLGKETEESDRNPLSLFTQLPVRRLEIRFGKFSLADFFDQNGVGSDSHLQFLNWTIDNSGAYDYAADTRGYTEGLYLEFHDRLWSFRFAETLMPTVANGLKLERDIAQARGENFEFELRPELVRNRKTTVRLLSFVNHAFMGSYAQAIREYLSGVTPMPDVTATRRQGTVKYGFGLNLEQEITTDIRAFCRTGWNEGQHESFVYTEVNQTVSCGGDVRGTRWRRRNDKLGVALVSNAISAVHQEYLRLGGVGFLLGDGGLNYGRETAVESYYNVHLWRGIFAAADLQHITNPGYNRDRGPVWVPSLRLHVDF